MSYWTPDTYKWVLFFAKLPDNIWRPVKFEFQINIIFSMSPVLQILHGITYLGDLATLLLCPSSQCLRLEFERDMRTMAIDWNCEELICKHVRLPPTPSWWMVYYGMPPQLNLCVFSTADMNLVSTSQIWRNVILYFFNSTEFLFQNPIFSEEAEP